MTNEEWEKMERTMAFLLDSAARHDAQIQANKEEMAELRESQKRTEKLLSGTIEAVTQLSIAVNVLSQKIDRVADQAEHDRQMLLRMIAEMKADGQRRDEDAERDRRIIREMVADLKDSIRIVNDKADRANRRLDRIEAASGQPEAEN